jgi:5-methylcytosine-specific restriction endonuclease McrA
MNTNECTDGDWPPIEKSYEKLSKVKKKILELLWSMEWIEGKEIFKVVQQTYYDRRIRELRKSGWQIETQGTKYRLNSKSKLAGTARKYPSVKLKQAVKERGKGVCQICGVSSGDLQYDHKIPLERQGPTELNNLQLLCSACNVEKRGICKRCTLPTCERCAYAFPELYRNRLAVFLDDDVAVKLKMDMAKEGINAARKVSDIVAQYYQDETR